MTDQDLVPRRRWGAVVSRLDPGGWSRLVVVVAAGILLAVQSPVTIEVYGVATAPAFLLSVAHVLAAPTAIWRPRFALVLSLAAAGTTMLLAASAAVGPWPWAVVPMLTQLLVLVVIGFQWPWRLGLTGLVASLMVGGVVAVIASGTRNFDSSAGNLVLFTCLAATALGAAVMVRSRHEIRAELLREQRLSAEEQSRRRLVEEKSRIARELHDVIAHNMSLISIQAQSASLRHEGVPAAVSAEFDQIAAHARQALAQMRGVLAVLREPGADGEFAPQPALTDIPPLVEQVRRAGLPIELSWQIPDDHVVAPAVGLCAHRIVQEALSNVVRHAPGAPATVLVAVNDEVVEVRVDNALGPGSARPPAPGGLGLTGMRERAAAVGGTVDHGTSADGGFGVIARLPIRGGGAV